MLPSPAITPAGSPISPPKRYILSNESPMHKRQRKSQPHRSIAQPQEDKEKQSQGIIKLDVYSVFMKNPGSLLYAPLTYPSPSNSRKSDAPSSPIGSKPLFRGQKSIPEDVKHGVRLDMEFFRDTAGAPLVQWKGNSAESVGGQTD
jgi:hypothetical protein